MEQDIQNKETRIISVGNLVLIQSLLFFLMVFQIFRSSIFYKDASSFDLGIFINITRVALCLVAIYTIVLSVRKFIKEGRKTNIGYVVLIILSLFGFASGLFPVLSLLLF
jgi:hypothetical protein